MELDWFWRDWILHHRAARPGGGLGHPSTRPAIAMIHLSNRGSMILPAELRITYEDGTNDTVRLPVEMWNLGPRFAYRVLSKKKVRRAEVDPRSVMPDVERANNRWPR